MSEGPTREEFERLYSTMIEGFRGVHDRLDTLNGRTLKGELADENLRVRVVGLEKEVFRPAIAAVQAVAESRTPAVQAALITIGVAAVVAIAKLFEVIGAKAVEGIARALAKS